VNDKKAKKTECHTMEVFIEMYALRASGLIPVNPLIVINKDTQLPMYNAEQAIIN